MLNSKVNTNRYGSEISLCFRMLAVDKSIGIWAEVIVTKDYKLEKYGEVLMFIIADVFKNRFMEEKKLYDLFFIPDQKSSPHL